MHPKSVTTIPFRKIKKGEFFRVTRAPKRLYQKFRVRQAQTVAGYGLGKAVALRPEEQVIPVAAELLIP